MADSEMVIYVCDTQSGKRLACDGTEAAVGTLVLWEGPETELQAKLDELHRQLGIPLFVDGRDEWVPDSMSFRIRIVRVIRGRLKTTYLSAQNADAGLTLINALSMFLNVHGALPVGFGLEISPDKTNWYEWTDVHGNPIDQYCLGDDLTMVPPWEKGQTGPATDQCGRREGF